MAVSGHCWQAIGETASGMVSLVSSLVKDTRSESVMWVLNVVELMRTSYQGKGRATGTASLRGSFDL